MTRLALGLSLALLWTGASAPAQAQAQTNASAGPIPSFSATALNGATVSSGQLIGQPTILIVTPSKEAAQDTRQWASTLRQTIGQQAYRIRDVLAIDLPFFMSESDAIDRAKATIPARYHDQTWLLDKPILKRWLAIAPDSHHAFVIVLNKAGKVVARVEGGPNDTKVQTLQAALQALR